MQKQDVKNILQIASVYIGAVIGAGFASGQEIIQFFTQYGIKGMYGLLLAGALQGLIGAVLLEVVYEKKWDSYDTCMRTLMGKGLGSALKWLVNVFLFVCFTAMVAGAGAILNQQFGLPVWVGSVMMMLASMFTFLSGHKGFVKMNSLLVPVLCIGAVILGSYVLVFRDVSVFSTASINILPKNWFTSAVVYVSYNMMTVMVVLISLRKMTTNRTVARCAGMLGGLGLGIVGLCIGGCTLMYYENIRHLEIPMLGILIDYPGVFQILYLVVLILAMYTTAIANGYGVIENLTQKSPMNKIVVIMTMSLLGLLGAKIGFSHIVANIFPLFGYIGCFEILILIVYYGCMKWEYRRN